MATNTIIILWSGKNTHHNAPHSGFPHCTEGFHWPPVASDRPMFILHTKYLMHCMHCLSHVHRKHTMVSLRPSLQTHLGHIHTYTHTRCRRGSLLRCDNWPIDLDEHICGRINRRTFWPCRPLSTARNTHTHTCTRLYRMLVLWNLPVVPSVHHVWCTSL